MFAPCYIPPPFPGLHSVIVGLDQTYRAHRFIFTSFLIIFCSRLMSMTHLPKVVAKKTVPVPDASHMQFGTEIFWNEPVSCNEHVYDNGTSFLVRVFGADFWYVMGVNCLAVSCWLHVEFVVSYRIVFNSFLKYTDCWTFWCRSVPAWSRKPSTRNPLAACRQDHVPWISFV